MQERTRKPAHAQSCRGVNTHPVSTATLAYFGCNFNKPDSWYSPPAHLLFTVTFQRRTVLQDQLFQWITTYKLFLFKINHRRVPCEGRIAAVTYGLLLIRCFNSTRALVLVSLNDLHERARKPSSSEFSRGKNPCQTPLQPNSREDAAGSLAAQAWTQKAKCFHPKSSCMSPTSCCFLQPASLTAQLEVGNYPVVHKLMAKLNPCYTAFPWEFGIPLSAQTMPFWGTATP